jgi:hypothetical protein
MMFRFDKRNDKFRFATTVVQPKLAGRRFRSRIKPAIDASRRLAASGYPGMGAASAIIGGMQKTIDLTPFRVYILDSHPLRADCAMRSGVPVSHFQHHTLSGVSLFGAKACSP